jgi:hypothetical protein
VVWWRGVALQKFLSGLDTPAAPQHTQKQRKIPALPDAYHWVTGGIAPIVLPAFRTYAKGRCSVLGGDAPETLNVRAYKAAMEARNGEA